MLTFKQGDVIGPQRSSDVSIYSISVNVSVSESMELRVVCLGADTALCALLTW